MRRLSSHSTFGLMGLFALVVSPMPARAQQVIGIPNPLQGRTVMSVPATSTVAPPTSVPVVTSRRGLFGMGQRRATVVPQGTPRRGLFGRRSGTTFGSPIAIPAGATTTLPGGVTVRGFSTTATGPLTPAIGGVPTVPGVPGINAAPTIPGVPSAVGVPGVNAAPGLPSVPGAPTLPGVPTVPATPTLPGAPSGAAPSVIVR